MKKATTILLLLFGFWSMSAQIPAFSATTTWRVADGNNTWVGTALQNKTYLAAGTLSKVDDTNITLTLGGTPAAALFNSVSITAGWTGTLAATRGGTGKTATDLTAATAGDMLVLNAGKTGYDFVSSPYKVYTALLTQTGTSAPTATILKNTLGVTPTFTYTTNGDYDITTSVDAFTANKTWVVCATGNQSDPAKAVPVLCSHLQKVHGSNIDFTL